MPRYKLTIEYQGTGYVGWQHQEGERSIQGELEYALKAFSDGTSSEVHGAGRTDAGVHATAMTAHIDLERETKPYNVMQGLNYHLFNRPDAQGVLQPILDNGIAVTKAEPVDDEFHARFSATRRYYLYRIINRRARLGLDINRAWQVHEKLDISAMQKAANHLLGHHDFTSFRDSMCQAKSPVKTLDTLTITRQGDDVYINTDARSFLHHQVRIITGTLVWVGKGKIDADEIPRILDAKNRDAAGPTAPPDGLYLTGVAY